MKRMAIFPLALTLVAGALSLGLSSPAAAETVCKKVWQHGGGTSTKPPPDSGCGKAKDGGTVCKKVWQHGGGTSTKPPPKSGCGKAGASSVPATTDETTTDETTTDETTTDETTTDETTTDETTTTEDTGTTESALALTQESP